MPDVTPLMRLLLHKKPVDTLLALAELKETYASVVAKKTDCTYPYTLKILDDLEGEDLVEFSKVGRIKHVKLTPRGVDIAHDLLGLVRHLNQTDEKIREEAEEETQEGD
ncbi:MAG: MarR family winged helix-turn-helix transcriptional regulator [Methanobacteriota archaeon]